MLAPTESVLYLLTYTVLINKVPLRLNLSALTDEVLDRLRKYRIDCKRYSLTKNIAPIKIYIAPTEGCYAASLYTATT